MDKSIDIRYKGERYVLKFTKDTVRRMIRAGFKLGDIADEGLVTLPELFAGAFLANHKNVKRELIDEIYSTMRDRSELFMKLQAMYREPFEVFLSDPEENEENASWTASW